ncbi:MAG: hypothetical protein IPP90_04015 [Gemmatimonadaceae bacterium]|nr:hypothetical protein [Gemmatimonadaceae bacterium]
MMRRLPRWAAYLAMMPLTFGFVATRVEAQRTHVLVVSGLSGDPAFRTSFQQVAATVKEVARVKWSVNDSSLIVLTEDSVPTAVSRGRSTRDAVGQAFTTLSTRVLPGDVLLVVLVGHGSGEGPGSKVNLPGPDATATDYATWLSGFTKQTVVVVNTATGSGDFLPVLKAPGRVVITATRSAVEKNESVFAGLFAKALASDESDADKDGRVSVMEAFRYTSREVAKVYESTGRMQTEHAQISDSTRATTVSFGRTMVSTDPRIAALVSERLALESDVAALRAKKATMDAATYSRELERLLLAMAEKTQAIRAAGGKP